MAALIGKQLESRTVSEDLRPENLLRVASYYLEQYIEGGDDHDISPLTIAKNFLQKALAQSLEQPPQDALSREFGIGVITRLDLIEFGFPEALIMGLSDEQMQKIAWGMGAIYADQGYWKDLDIIVSRVLGTNNSPES